MESLPQSNFQIWYWMINCHIETHKETEMTQERKEALFLKKV